MRRLTRPRWYRFRTAPESRGDHAVHMSAGWMLVDRAVRFAACAVVDDPNVAVRRRGRVPAGVERTTCAGAGARGRWTRKPDPQPHFGNAGSASLRRAGLAPDAHQCMPTRFPQTGCMRIVRAIRFRFAPSHRALSHR
ncbi:hypothetical protein BVI434_4030001 [Burkholderia vietnamiensis]|nr:hypothetical protein BVI434_4030001 [Burkholderia vietnamiensis]